MAKSSLTKVSRPFNREKKSLQYTVDEPRYPHAKERDPYFIAYTKINLKWI